MKRALLTSTLLLGSLFGSALGAHAATLIWNDTHKPARSNELPIAADACDRAAGVQRGTPSADYRRCMGRYGWRFSHLQRDAKQPGAVKFDRDSRDPNVGWHWVNGMRTCTQDCDNPEIPGSGYSCSYHDGWRECVKR